MSQPALKFPFPGSGMARESPCHPALLPEAPRIPGPCPSLSGLPKSKPQSSQSSHVTSALCPIPLWEGEPAGIQGVDLPNSRALVLPKLHLF